MRALLGPVHRARFGQRIAAVDLADGEDAGEPSRPVAKRDRRAALERCRVLVGDGQRERQGPDGAVREAQAREHALVVRRPEEPGERARRAGADELEVGQLARVEHQRGEGVRRGAERVRLAG